MVVGVFMCVVEIVMSSAYVMSCVCLGGGGMSEVYMLESMGERTLCFKLALGGCSVFKCCMLFVLLCC